MYRLVSGGGLVSGALVQREQGTYIVSAVQLLCLGSICHDVGVEQFQSWNPCADLPSPPSLKCKVDVEDTLSGIFHMWPCPSVTHGHSNGPSTWEGRQQCFHTVFLLESPDVLCGKCRFSDSTPSFQLSESKWGQNTMQPTSPYGNSDAGGPGRH